MKNRFRSTSIICLSIGILMTASFYFNNQAFAGQAIALTWKYSFATQCNSGWGDLSAPSFGQEWESVMDNHYSYTVVDIAIDRSELTDTNSIYYGADHTYDNWDAGDATLLVTHGDMDDFYEPEEWYALKSFNTGSDCLEYSSNMNLGDNDAEFVHNVACNSAQYELAFQSGGYEILDGRIHQYGGFHGASNNMNWGKLDDFAADAWTTADSVSWAWIENLTKWNIRGWDPGANDLCAMSLVHGYNSTDALIRKNFEDYGSSYSDPPSNHWTKYHFYCDCNPPAGHNLSCT